MENTSLADESNVTTNGSDNYFNIQASTFYTSVAAFSVTEKAQLYAFVAVCPLALLLNTLCTAIFLRLKLHKTLSGLHLTCISVIDNLAILGIFTFAVNVQTHVSFPNVMTVNKYVCKLLFGVGAFALNSSSLLQTSLIVQRCISIYCPLKKRVCQTFIGIYFLISLAVGSLWYHTATYLNINGVKICAVDNKIFSGAWYFMLQNILYYGARNGVSSGLSVICTALIAFNLLKFRRRRVAVTMGQNAERQFAISLTLFFVSFVFVTAKIFELVVGRIIAYHWQKGVVTKVYENAIAALPIAQLFLVVNHSTNFFICLVFLQDFREYLVEMFEFCCENRLCKATQETSSGEENQGL